MSADVTQLRADLVDIKKNYTEKSKVALLSNVLANGDFHTAGAPILYYNATGSVSNNVLTATGGSSANTVEIRYYMPALANKHVFCVVDVQVNDDSCNKLSLYVSGRLNRSEIVKPIKDKWYRIAAYYTGTNPSNQNLIFEVVALYANSTTANGKTFNIKNAIAFYNDSDYGLGVKPPFYKLMNIVKMNDFWIGAKELTIEEYNYKYDTINNSQDSYVLPCRNAHQSLRRPIVTFVCDDGWQDDYYKLAPISEKHQVPFASAIFDGSTLTEWQEYYLQNELGWEFVSHPENAPLADKATEAAIIKAMIDTNEYLTNRGLKYYNIVYPYGSSDERVRRLAKKYYRCGCTTNAGINTGVVPSFYLDRWPMGYGNGDNNTLNFFKSKVDATVAANGWLIFMLHPHMEQHTETLTQIIDDLITYIKSIDVEIMTLNDGYSIFGNALECGDYIGSTDGIAISFDGHTANI